MSDTTENRLQKFTGAARDDYSLWKLRAELILKSKGYWSKLSQEGDDAAAAKEKAAAILVSSLGDTPLRVCADFISEPLQMLGALDTRYASRRVASQIATLTAVYSKTYSAGQNMAKYIDEFATLFAQLESMGPDASVPASHKAPLLLASLGNRSAYESLISAMMLKSPSELSWEMVTADLIQESQRVTAGRGGNGNNRNHGDKKRRGNGSANKKDSATVTVSAKTASAGSAGASCDYCGRKGNMSEQCYINPDSPACKLPQQAINSYKAKTGHVKNSTEPKQKSPKKNVIIGGTALIRGARAQSHTHSKMHACLDSGATHTMLPGPNHVVSGTYDQKNGGALGELAAGENRAVVLGTGTVQYGSLSMNAVHVKGLNGPLISVGQVCDQNKCVVFTKNEVVILNTPMLSIASELVQERVPRDANGLFTLRSDIYNVDNEAISGGVAKADPKGDLWHRRLIHANNKVVRQAVPGVSDFRDFCTACKLGKTTQKSISSSFAEVSIPGERVHSDTTMLLQSGRHNSNSIQGSKYLCTFVDQRTRWISTAGLRRKSHTNAAFQANKKSSPVSAFPSGVQELHSDGGGEYAFMDNEEIRHNTTFPDTRQHNGFAERVNRTLFDPARTMLEEAGLSAKYTEYAVHHVAYIKNRLPHSSIRMSPYEALYHKKPKLHHTRVFGCAAFVYNRNPKTKAHSRASTGIFLGTNDFGEYTVELLTTGKIVRLVHVTFDESSFPKLEKESSSSSAESESEYSESTDDANSDSEEGSMDSLSDGGHVLLSDSDSDQLELEESAPRSDSESVADSESQFVPNLEEPDQLVEVEESADDDPEGPITEAEAGTSNPGSFGGGPRRKQPPRAVKRTAFGAALATQVTIPITTSDNPTVSEALNSNPAESQLWKGAIEAEFASLDKKGTWQAVGYCNVVVSPSGAKRIVKPLPTHIILKIKRDSNGQPSRFKARAVVGGHQRKKRVDYNRTYPPVASFAVVRLILVLMLQFGWSAKHVDVKTAFLNGNLDHTIFASHPRLTRRHRLHRRTLYLLLKALYGLHQAPRQ